MTTRGPGTHNPSYLLCLGSLHQGHLRSPLRGHLCLPSAAARRCPGARAKKPSSDASSCEQNPSQETFLWPSAADPHTPHTSAAPGYALGEESEGVA